MVHLARYSDDKFAVALIYPAEYDDEISGWLLNISLNQRVLPREASRSN